MTSSRREFLASAAALALPRGEAAAEPPVQWRRGELQVHFIYAGSSESAFYIFPDGTTMLVDCGDYDCGGNWKMRNPVEPLRGMGPGEFVARYIRRVNPSKDFVDYWMLTHWHADHGGCEVSYQRRGERDGEVWLYGGLAELVDYIRFGKGFDRCWPNLSDPFPVKDTHVRQFAQISRTYRWMERRQGVKIEKFRVGADDQVVLRNDPAAFPDFKVLNICGNGVIRTRNGGVRNLYEGFVPKDNADAWRRENGLSLGFVASYGAFRLYAAGDFQDFWRLPDGAAFQTEDALAAEVDGVDVAKTNHHASDSMTPALVKALSARVWVTSSISHYANWPTTMRRLSDRSTYPGDRLIAPTHYALDERMAEMGEADAKRDVAPESYGCCHVVVTVPPGGESYSVSFLSPDCDAPRLLRTLGFRSKKGQS